jgi:hypothetical protein
MFTKPLLIGWLGIISTDLALFGINSMVKEANNFYVS